MGDIVSFFTGAVIKSKADERAYHRAVVKLSEQERPMISGWKNMGVSGFLDAVCDDMRLNPSCPIIDAVIDTISLQR